MVCVHLHLDEVLREQRLGGSADAALLAHACRHARIRFVVLHRFLSHLLAPLPAHHTPHTAQIIDNLLKDDA
jgi:hypothetical protein